MILPECDQFIPQSLDLALQLHAVQVCVIDELAQAADVLLHALAQVLLSLISVQ